MTLGQNIKKLRRGRDITQEQLAQYMNVSVSAVSQWESGRTAPDISALPALCALLRVSSDELLGIDNTRREAEINEMLDRVWDVFDEKKNDEGLHIMRAMLRRYPDAYRLMTEIAFVLVNLAENGCVDSAAAYDEICGYLEKIFADCTDSAVRSDAVTLACIVYPKVGRKDEAVPIARSAGKPKTTLELLALVYDGQERMGAIRDRMWYLYNDFQLAINGLCYEKDAAGNFILSDDDRIALFQKRIALTEAVFEDGDYLFFSHWLKSANMELAEIYVRRGDVEEAFLRLAEAAKYAVMFDTYDPNARWTSVLLRGICADTTYTYGTTSCRELLKWCRSEPCLDLVRADERFAETVRTLESAIAAHPAAVADARGR